MMYKKQLQHQTLHKQHKRLPSARSQMYGLSGMVSMFFIALIWMRAISVGHQAFNLIATTDLIQDNDVMDAYSRNLAIQHRKKTRARKLSAVVDESSTIAAATTASSNTGKTGKQSAVRVSATAANAVIPATIAASTTAHAAASATRAAKEEPNAAPVAVPVTVTSSSAADNVDTTTAVVAAAVATAASAAVVANPTTAQPTLTPTRQPTTVQPTASPQLRAATTPQPATQAPVTATAAPVAPPPTSEADTPVQVPVQVAAEVVPIEVPVEVPVQAPVEVLAPVEATTTMAAGAAAVAAVPELKSDSSSSSLPLVEFHDCRNLAPCHVKGEDTDLKCATFYAKRFWERAPQQLKDKLQWQRDHRPLNCWYETELLSFARLPQTSNKPYKKAVCRDNGQSIPENVVYWHNFKAAGTTARHSLGVWGFPNYQPAQHIFSDELPNLVPKNVGHTLPDGLSEPTKEVNFADFEAYLQLVDRLKQEAFDRQMADSSANMGFTFVRSPVQRFLSGLEQVERLNDTYWEVSPEAKPCMELTDAHAKVECVVDSMLTTRVFFNVHVYPQAYLFDTWTKRGEYDMAITVLDLKDMDDLFKRFKGKKIVRLRESSVEGTKLNLKAKDLSPTLLVKICQLYEADLLMLQTLGMEDPLCAAALAPSPAISTN